MKKLVFLPFFIINLIPALIAANGLPYPESELIAYKAENPKTNLLVYTDIDCGYCRKLHEEIPDLNASGISVYYAPFPRAGIDSKSYKKFVSVYCSEDKQKALTKAKNNFILPKQDCDNPVAKIYQNGVSKNVGGTPMILTDDNRQLGGYQTAKELTAALDIKFVAATDAQLNAFKPLQFEHQDIKETYYQAKKKVSWYSQPSREKEKSGDIPANHVIAAAIKTEVDGEIWLATVHQQNIYYIPASQLTKVIEKRDYDTKEIKSAHYIAINDANTYLVADSSSPSVTTLPANYYAEFTFEYEGQGEHWLGYKHNDIKYFILRKDLRPK